MDAVLVQLDRPRGNRRQMRKAEDGRPNPEGERHGRHPRHAPRSRNGAVKTMRRHRTDHSARSIAARIPGKPDERLAQLLAARSNSLSPFAHTRLYKLISRNFSKFQLRIEKSCVFETVPIEVNKSLIAT